MTIKNPTSRKVTKYTNQPPFIRITAVSCHFKDYIGKGISIRWKYSENCLQLCVLFVGYMKISLRPPTSIGPNISPFFQPQRTYTAPDFFIHLQIYLNLVPRHQTYLDNIESVLKKTSIWQWNEGKVPAVSDQESKDLK